MSFSSTQTFYSFWETQSSSLRRFFGEVFQVLLVGGRGLLRLCNASSHKKAIYWIPISNPNWSPIIDHHNWPADFMASDCRAQWMEYILPRVDDNGSYGGFLDCFINQDYHLNKDWHCATIWQCSMDPRGGQLACDNSAVNCFWLS
mgnify:CR=1 FL=1